MPQRSQRSPSTVKQLQLAKHKLRIANCTSVRGGGFPLFLCVLCVLCGESTCCTLSATAAPQTVVPVEGAAFQGELVSIDASGRATFRVANGKEKGDENRTLPLSDLVRWGNPVLPRPQTIVVLSDGGQIVTVPDWVGGASVRLVGDDVILRSDISNDVRLPLEQVSGIVFAQQSRPDEREGFVERVRGERSPDRSDLGKSSPEMAWSRS